ncbi:hypothetical protein ACS0TY_012213 [Phlomoides rotata]
MVLCGRCKLLSHGHMITAVGGNGGYPGRKQFVTTEELREKLSHLRHEKALIVKLVDIVDFNSSFLAHVHDLAGSNPIILVITKAAAKIRSTMHQSHEKSYVLHGHGLASDGNRETSVFVAAALKISQPFPADTTHIYQYDDEAQNSFPPSRFLKWLEKAAIILPDVSLENQVRNRRWRLCSFEEVEAAKFIFRVIQS